MKSLFSRFGASFTPYFLNRYKRTTLGQSVAYYFFWFFVSTILVIVGLGIFTWYISSPERVTPFLAKIPSFELQFQDNKLVKTSFPNDPFILPFEGTFLVFISPKSVTIPGEYASQPGIYLLHDRFIGNQIQSAAKKTTEVSYADMKLGNTLFNNALLAQRFAEIYPTARNKFLPMIFPIGFAVGAICALFFFVMSFFWSLVIFLISKISKLPRLSYEESFVFILHSFFPVMLLSIASALSNIYFLFLPTFLFVGIFLFNAFAGTCHSPSTKRK